jgi:hypothetical protein
MERQLLQIYTIIMETITKIFEKQGFRLHHGVIKDYYPGSCDQCQMCKAGQKSIIYGLTPNLLLLICDKCYEIKEPVIKEIIENLQKSTFFDKIPKNKKFEILDENGEIDTEWMIHPRYLFFIPQGKTVYFPLIKENCNEKWVSLRHLSILNDLVIS